MISRCLFFLLGLGGLVATVMSVQAAAAPGQQAASGPSIRQHFEMSELRTALTSESPLRGWVDRLEASVARGDSTEFDTFLKADWLLDGIMRPVPGKGEIPEIEAAFAQGTRTSWTNRSLSIDYLGHQFRFLRVHTLGGRSGLLFRSAGENGQLNYCLFSVAVGPDGMLGADDLYVVGMGEWLSDTLRRGYLTLVESLTPRGESGRRATLYVDMLPRITAMQAALAQKDYPKVLAISSLLPPEVLQDRQILLTRLEAAEHISLSERSRIFNEWKALHPNPEQLPLKWADYHIATGKFHEARAVLAALNDRIGGDTYLMLRLGEIKMLATHHEAGHLLGGRPERPDDVPERAANDQ